jgi:hypothetical protein
MVGSEKFMGYTILLHEMIKNPIAKRLASITDNNTWSTKTSKNIVFQKLNHNLVVICFPSLGFHPLRHVINSDRIKRLP